MSQAQKEKKIFTPEKVEEIRFENKTYKYIKSLGFNEERVYEMMKLVSSEKMDLKKLDNLTKSGYSKKEALLAQLFEKNDNGEFYIKDKTKETFAKYFDASKEIMEGSVTIGKGGLVTIRSGNLEYNVSYKNPEKAKEFLKSDSIENLVDKGFDLSFLNEIKKSDISLGKKMSLYYTKSQIYDPEVQIEGKDRMKGMEFYDESRKWVEKELAKGREFDEVMKALRKDSKGRYYTNEKMIAEYRDKNKMQYVAKKPDTVKEEKVTKSEVKKEATAQKLIDETKKELTLFEKLYGIGDLDFKIKIVGEEMARRKTDKTKVAEKKDEKKEVKREKKEETQLEKNTREIREMKKAQMEKDAEKVESEKRTRKGEEQTIVKEDMSKVTQEEIKKWTTKDIESLTLEQFKKLNNEQLRALEDNENINKVDEKTRKKIFSLWE